MWRLGTTYILFPPLPDANETGTNTPLIIPPMPDRRPASIATFSLASIVSPGLFGGLHADRLTGRWNCKACRDFGRGDPYPDICGTFLVPQLRPLVRVKPFAEFRKHRQGSLPLAVQNERLITDFSDATVR